MSCFFPPYFLKLESYVPWTHSHSPLRVYHPVLKSLHFCVYAHTNTHTYTYMRGFSGGSNGKESSCNAGDSSLILGLGRSPGEGNGNPLHYSSLENSMDRGAWRAAVHGVAKSQTQPTRLLICIFYWCMVDLQCFSYAAKSVVGVYIHTHTHRYILFHIIFHCRLLQAVESSSLCYEVGTCCLSNFMHSSVYLLIPNSSFMCPFPFPFQWP